MLLDKFIIPFIAIRNKPMYTLKLFLVFNKSAFFLAPMTLFFFFSRVYLLNFNYIDVLSRTSLNEPYVSLYSFFWTSFWYLPLFFSLITIYVILYSSYNLKLLGSVFYFVIVIYFYSCVSLLSSNLDLVFFNFTVSNFNFFLLNSLNKYHPFIFYMSTWCAVVVLFLFYKAWGIANNFSFYKSFFFLKTWLILLFLFLFNLFSLFLGSWWAFQEGTWGGWWNWDSSEVFGLLFLLIAVFFFHFKNNSNFLPKLWYFLIIFTFTNIIVYYFIQLNFDLVSHNFGIKFFFFFNNNFFFIELLILFFFLLLATFRVYVSMLYQFALIRSFLTLNNRLTLRCVFFLFLIFLVCTYRYAFISFGPLLNFFFWNFFSISVVNLEYVSGYIFLVLILSYFILVRDLSFHFYFFTYSFIVFNFLCFFFSMVAFLCYFSLTHTPLLTFCNLNLLGYYKNLSFPSITDFLSFFDFSTNSLLSKYGRVCDGSGIESSVTSYIHGSLIHDSWGIQLLISPFHNNFFTFLLSHNTCYNVISPDTSYAVFTTYIEGLFINHLLLWTSLVFFFITLAITGRCSSYF